MKLIKMSCVVAFSFGLVANAQAADITVSTKGMLGGIGSFDFNGSKNGYAGVLAHAGADFSLTNGLKWGLGAIGAWAAWQQTDRGNTAPYSSSGDASEAYIGFQNKLISVYGGRFQNSFTRFDWLQGNVQGLSIRFSTYEDKMSYWLTYANSYLYNGKQHNYSQGDRIAADLTSLSAYNPTSKNGLVGGEIIAAGVDFSVNHFLLKPFALINTDGAKSGKAIIQGGIKAGTNFNLGSSFKTTIIAHGLYQYWDIVPNNGSAHSVLVWGDVTFKYKDFLQFGGGVLGIIANENSFIYALSDSSRFYGRSLMMGSANTGFGYTAPYLRGSSLFGYIFAGFDWKWIRIDGMAAFGHYNEYSIMSSFKVWKQNNMRLDVGGGYIYASTTRNSVSSAFANSLNIFVKFSY